MAIIYCWKIQFCLKPFLFSIWHRMRRQRSLDLAEWQDQPLRKDNPLRSTKPVQLRQEMATVLFHWIPSTARRVKFSMRRTRRKCSSMSMRTTLTLKGLTSVRKRLIKSERLTKHSETLVFLFQIQLRSNLYINIFSFLSIVPVKHCYR